MRFWTPIILFVSLLVVLVGVGVYLGFRNVQSLRGNVNTRSATGSETRNRSTEPIEEKSTRISVPLPFPIAFTSERDGQKEIYITIDAGSDGMNITNHESDDTSFLPFEDGGIFVSQRNGDHDVFYVHYINGLAIENLSDNPAVEKQIAVSSDFKKLLFTSTRDGNVDIFLFLSEGFPPRNLTRNESSDEFPVWMPDGNRFLFESDREGNYDIFLQYIDGTTSKNVTQNPASDRFPMPSPDGKYLAFESNRDGSVRILMYNFDNEQTELISSDTGSDNTPLFSHDGKSLVFNHVENEMSKIQIMNLADKNIRDITDYEKAIGVSGFSPDDKWLMFVSKRTGDLDVFILNLESSKLINVTNHDGSDYYPAFLPSMDSPFIKSLFPESNF